MTVLSDQLQAASGLRNALARRIAADAVKGEMPTSTSRDLYAEYEATVDRIFTEIMDAAKLPEPAE